MRPIALKTGLSQSPPRWRNDNVKGRKGREYSVLVALNALFSPKTKIRCTNFVCSIIHETKSVSFAQTLCAQSNLHLLTQGERRGLQVRDLLLESFLSSSSRSNSAVSLTNGQPRTISFHSVAAVCVSCNKTDVSKLHKLEIVQLQLPTIT